MACASTPRMNFLHAHTYYAHSAVNHPRCPGAKLQETTFTFPSGLHCTVVCSHNGNRDRLTRHQLMEVRQDHSSPGPFPKGKAVLSGHLIPLIQLLANHGCNMVDGNWSLTLHVFMHGNYLHMSQLTGIATSMPLAFWENGCTGCPLP